MKLELKHSKKRCTGCQRDYTHVHDGEPIPGVHFITCPEHPDYGKPREEWKTLPLKAQDSITNPCAEIDVPTGLFGVDSLSTEGESWLDEKHTTTPLTLETIMEAMEKIKAVSGKPDYGTPGLYPHQVKAFQELYSSHETKEKARRAGYTPLIVGDERVKPGRILILKSRAPRHTTPFIIRPTALDLEEPETRIADRLKALTYGMHTDKLKSIVYHNEVMAEPVPREPDPPAAYAMDRRLTEPVQPVLGERTSLIESITQQDKENAPRKEKAPFWKRLIGRHHK